MQQHQGVRLGTKVKITDASVGQVYDVALFGTYDCQVASPQPLDQLSPQINAQLVQAIQTVLVGAAHRDRLPLPGLQASLAHFAPQIVQAAAPGLAPLGVTVTNLQLQMALPADHPTQVAAQAAQAGAAAAANVPSPAQAAAQAAQAAAQAAVDPRNYRVEASVGGIDVGVGGGGVKVDGVAEKIKTEIAWKIGGCVVALLLAVFLLALFGYIAYVSYGKYRAASAEATAAAGTSDAPAKAAWNGKKPYSCTGNKHVEIKGVTAKLDRGPAIKSNGCSLTLVDVNITAPVGISATGKSVITVKGGSITSTDLAIKALGSATVTVEGAKITGKTQAVGANAKIVGVE